MKVSKDWLKELVELKVSMDELVRLLPLRTIGTKEVTSEFIELDMKGYNRADLLSLRGIAYEVSAITDSSLKFKENNEHIWDGSFDSAQDVSRLPKVEIEVKDKVLAPLYCLAKITGLRVQPSNKDWIKKLTDSGVRSINNIADVTNLVMLEYGQPLHAFDAKEVVEERIIVRTAKKGEDLITLDNKKRVLENSDLLITDSQKALGLAGVMGGKNSEVSNSTTTILLEAAIFDPKNLRKTATRLGLQSEASKRFYHGLTQKRLFQALSAAIKMYEELGGKLEGLSIVGDYPEKTKEIKLTQAKVNSLIGIEIKTAEVESYLKKLNFEVKRDSPMLDRSESDSLHRTTSPAPLNDNSKWLIRPPYFRLDVEIEEDVIEEIARMYGYEKIPAKSLVGEVPDKVDQSLFSLIHNIKNELVKLGLTELQTYPYFSTKVLANFGWSKDDNKKNLVKVANPISAETEYLRQNIWQNLLEKTAENLKYFDQITIFEIGKVYIPQTKGEPKEKYSLAIALVNQTDNPIAQLNTIFKDLIKRLDLKIEIVHPKKISELEQTFLHPKRVLHLDKDGIQIGGFSDVHPRVANKFGIEKRVAVLEVYITELL